VGAVTAEAMYALLPAALRTADERAGGAVRDIVEVLARQLDAVEVDIEQLGEDWFIETCAPWVVPYIGDLLGEAPAHGIDGLPTPRARVANALAYRRRKGTAAVLEALTRDTTGWPARAVELYRLLAATQHLDHVVAERPARVSLRDASALELVDGPFDAAPHAVDVRRLGHNIPNVALHVWRLASQWVDRATARALPADDGRYHADPLGRDVPLFGRPAAEAGISQLAGEEHVPAPLRRRALAADLARLRADLAAGREPHPRFFGPQPPLRVFVQATAASEPLETPPEQLDACLLDDWRRPEAGRVAFDPATGRIALPAGQRPHRVLVSSASGLAGDIGAGPFDRRAALAALLDRPVTWQVGVSRDVPADGVAIFATLGEAVQAWNGRPDGTVGLIAVMDSHVYDEDLTGPNRVTAGEGSLLVIAAAGWPELPVPGGVPGEVRRLPGRVDAAGVRPCLLGGVEVRGTAPDDSPDPGEVALHGLLVAGQVRVRSAGGRDLGALTLSHCTLEPDGGGVRVGAGNEHLAVRIVRSLTGPVSLDPATPVLEIADSVVGGALTGRGAAAVTSGVTVLGRAAVREIEATDTIFRDGIAVDRVQAGCARFSYLAPGSRAPRRYRCQPDLALDAAPASEGAAVRARVVPSFTSERPADPGFAQLGPACPPEIAAGGEGGTEMGAFAFLHNPQRAAGLTADLDDYLRFGLQAGLIAAT
jgi:hypothetical protein